MFGCKIWRMCYCERGNSSFDRLVSTCHHRQNIESLFSFSRSFCNGPLLTVGLQVGKSGVSSSNLRTTRSLPLQDLWPVYERNLLYQDPRIAQNINVITSKGFKRLISGVYWACLQSRTASSTPYSSYLACIFSYRFSAQAIDSNSEPKKRTDVIECCGNSLNRPHLEFNYCLGGCYCTQTWALWNMLQFRWNEILFRLHIFYE